MEKIDKSEFFVAKCVEADQVIINPKYIREQGITAKELGMFYCSCVDCVMIECFCGKPQDVLDNLEAAPLPGFYRENIKNMCHAILNNKKKTSKNPAD
ncbi:MAG: hypothetical protein ACM3KR_05080 [Deltaproteobacteria bacterium]